MSANELDALDSPLISRQQRIADLLRSTLPEIEAGQRRNLTLRRLAIVAAMLFIFCGGYNIGQAFRPLSYSEKMIVQTLVEHAAKQQNKTAAEVTRHLLAELHEPAIKDIKSHQLSDTLLILGRYFD